MAKKKKSDNPRILIVTPEITYLPPGMGNMAQRLSAKAGGLADVSASLVSALFNLGADVHVALPNFRKMFQGDVFNFHEKQLKKYHEVLPEDHIHLAEDRIFYYKDSIYSSHDEEAMRVAMIFQREVINHIVPKARPDLIHCNDWMTSLIPAMAKRRGIKSLFTIHNIHTRQVSLEQAEETGIDAAEFWMNLYFTQNPGGYDNARANVPVDLLTSGIFASHFINTVSPRFLWEIVEGWHPVVPWSVREEMRNKYHAGCASGILNAPDASYNPSTDDALVQNFSHKDFWEGKRANKEAFQREMGLYVNADAPLFFWPSRLDPVQKGPELVTDILYQVISDYWDRPMQFAVVANGPHEIFFRDLIRDFNLEGRVAIVNFDERMSRLGYAASDFMVMPSLFEPCGLPQMTAPLYGSLPVVHSTGGLYDTIRPMDIENSCGNGFRFDDYTSAGLRWAIDRAMEFHALPYEAREPQIRRVIKESVKEFSHEQVAKNYIAIYEEMLARPLVENEAGVESPPAKKTH